MIRFNMRNISILTILFFLLLFLRRGAQLLQPQIWNEDGPFNMTSFILDGWCNLCEPTQGYLVLIPKLITNISMSISFVYYPEISTYLTWIFTVGLALLIVYAPTMLKYPVLAAVLMFLVPTNAEVFGLPLFTLWFSAIMLFLVALWEQGKKQILKNMLLIFGGFSSPTIVIIIPVQIFRLIFLPNKKEEIVTLVLSVVISMIQLSFIVHQGVRPGMHIDMLFIQSVIEKFFAYYYLGAFNLEHILLLFGGLYLIVLIIVYAIQNRKDVGFMILVYLLLATVALSVARMNPVTLAPIFGGGARYFFLPYTVLSWTLIHMMAKNKWYEALILPILILSLLTAFQGFCRTHADLHWRKHIDLCQKAEGKYPIPIQNDGKAEYAWQLVLDADICKQYIQSDLFKLPEGKEK